MVAQSQSQKVWVVYGTQQLADPHRVADTDQQVVRAARQLTVKTVVLNPNDHKEALTVYDAR
jgi:hypothetical protein